MFDILKKASPSVKYCIIAPALLAILYLISVADLEYGYYTFVRILSLIAVVVFLFTYWFVVTDFEKSFLSFPSITATVILILFNPARPLEFSKQIWTVIDILSAISMCAVSIYIFYIHAYLPEQKRQSEHKNTAKRTRELKAARRAAEESFDTCINKPYMLNISQEIITQCFISGAPYTELDRYIDHRIPSVSDFVHNIFLMISEVIDELNLTSEALDDLSQYLLFSINSMSETLTEADIQEISNNFNSAVPSEMRYLLRNQINYELAVLGLMGEYSSLTNNQEVLDAVNRYRKIKHYI